MIVCVPHFQGTDPRFSLLLDAWVESYLTSGSVHPFLVLTDLASGFTKYPSLAIDTSPYNDLLRKGNEMDRKGALVCAGVQYLDGDVMIVDSDAFISAPLPVPAFPDKIGMAPDACKRSVRLPWEDADTSWPMLNAGVMYFGRGVNRTEVLKRYTAAFDQVVSAMPDEYLCEQLAWTLMHRRMNGVILHKRLNWVEHLWGKNDDAVIIHRHGKAKWSHLGL